MEVKLTYSDCVSIVVARRAVERLLADDKARGVSAQFLRDLTSGYMRKSYPRSRKGMEAVYRDLCRLEEAIKKAQAQP